MKDNITVKILAYNRNTNSELSPSVG